MTALALTPVVKSLGGRDIRTSTGFWRRFARHRMALIGLLFVLGVTLAAFVTPSVSPYDPYKMELAQARKTPSLSHPLGTDKLGRDTLTRVFVGGRISIEG